jgi:PAS domain S-box-containing protein
MQLDENEEKLLRSVAVQNARAVLHARERAERELIQTKEALEAKTEELARQREWFQVTLSSIGDAVITTDLEGAVTFLNPAAEAMTGWKDEEAIGRPLTEVFKIINEKTREPAENPITKVLREGVVVGLANHTALIARDGTETAIEDSAAPIKDATGKILGAVMVFQDVTERRKAEIARRRAEEALRESEQKLRAIFNQAAVGMAVAGLDGRFEQVNARFSEILGYSPEELFQLTFRDLTHPEDWPESEIKSRQLLDRELSDFSVENRYHRKDGSSLWSLTTVTLLRDEEGRARRFVGIIEDITSRKQAEAELQQAKEELEQRVLERTASLRETTEHLEAFCYTIAHDLRSPLRAQQSFAQVLLEDYKDRLDPAGLEYVQRIMNSAKRLDGLVDDLLTYSRLSREELEFETVDLENVFRDAQSALTPEINHREAILSIEPLLPVSAYLPILQHVITNLISNALKFSKPGEPPRIRVWSEQRDGFVRLWVEDNGVGISPENTEQIFGVFYRLHRMDKYPGTGIGLAIVRKGVERMGGRAGVESEPGKGSRFWIELPLAR